MERLQKEWTQKGVVWLTVISSAPGTQGYVTAEQENDYMRRMNAAPTAALLDPTGDLGHLYGAKTTPHMFIINPDGVLIYDGAIDDKPTPDPADIATSRNYVSLALDRGHVRQAGHHAHVAPLRLLGQVRPLMHGHGDRGRGAAVGVGRVERVGGGLRRRDRHLVAAHRAELRRDQEISSGRVPAQRDGRAGCDR